MLESFFAMTLIREAPSDNKTFLVLRAYSMLHISISNWLIKINMWILSTKSDEIFSKENMLSLDKMCC